MSDVHLIRKNNEGNEKMLGNVDYNREKERESNSVSNNNLQKEINAMRIQL